MAKNRVQNRRVDPLPERVAPQLATLVDSPPRRGEWTYEIKFDGYRILARIERGAVRMFTRNENDWTSKLESLAADVATLTVETAWLDGEAVVLGDNGIPDFNALQNAFDKTGTEGITYFVFDLLYLDGRDLRASPLHERRAMLEALFEGRVQDRVRLTDTFKTDGNSLLQSACKMGLEGIIAKRLDAPYRSTRSDTWQKVKCQLRQEFVIGGFTTRAGSGQEIGSLLLGVFDDDRKLRYVGSVGTGWDAMLAAALLRQMERIELDGMPFDPMYPPTKGRWSKRAVGGERWVQPTHVVEVSFTEWTPDGHIRHPTFKGMRKDKPAASVRREFPKE
jgi:bifunctional non-homologous end joining protein LigD